MTDPKQRLLADTVEYLAADGASDISLRQLTAALDTSQMEPPPGHPTTGSSHHCPPRSRVARGLLLDLLATGDREGTAAALSSSSRCTPGDDKGVLVKT